MAGNLYNTKMMHFLPYFGHALLGAKDESLKAVYAVYSTRNAYI